MIDASSRFLVAGDRRELRLCLGRAFGHADMNAVAGHFAQGRVAPKLAPALDGQTVPSELRQVARAFVDIQQARHEADYDLARPFRRQEVLDLIDEVHRAFTAWRAVRTTDPAMTFLVALLVHRHIRRS